MNLEIREVYYIGETEAQSYGLNTGEGKTIYGRDCDMYGVYEQKPIGFHYELRWIKDFPTLKQAEEFFKQGGKYDSNF